MSDVAVTAVSTQGRARGGRHSNPGLLNTAISPLQPSGQLLLFLANDLTLQDHLSNPIFTKQPLLDSHPFSSSSAPSAVLVFSDPVSLAVMVWTP